MRLAGGGAAAAAITPRQSERDEAGDEAMLLTLAKLLPLACFSDQNDPKVFEFFLEKNMIGCVKADVILLVKPTRLHDLFVSTRRTKSVNVSLELLTFFRTNVAARCRSCCC